jgi:hypothetical protein
LSRHILSKEYKKRAFNKLPRAGGLRERLAAEASAPQQRSREKFPLTWWDENKKFLIEEKSEREPGESSGGREKMAKRKDARRGRPENKSIYYRRFANLA